MTVILKDIASLFAIAVLLLSFSCARKEGNATPSTAVEPAAPVALATQPGSQPSPAIPNLQAELLDDRNKTTTSLIGQFDFKNFNYPLPRGWQNPDGSDLTLTNGRLEPIAVDTDLGMDPDEAAERKAQRRIGASYVTTKFLDVTGDGQDEGIVVLKIETTGSAIPQLVYIYEWKEGAPELLWNFRTGDRADGGLKDIRVANGQLVIELYGQDRFLLGETETGKITDDEEQLCCPTFYTRSFYNWNGKNFLMKGKRQTWSIADRHAPPIENMAEIIEKQKGGKK